MTRTPPPSPRNPPRLAPLIIPNNGAETEITELVAFPFQTTFAFFPFTNTNVPEEPDLPGDPENESAFFRMGDF